MSASTPTETLFVAVDPPTLSMMFAVMAIVESAAAVLSIVTMNVASADLPLTVAAAGVTVAAPVTIGRTSASPSASVA